MIAETAQHEIAIEALKRGCSDYITKDDLSPASLRRAAINALQKAHLSNDVELHQTGRKDMEAVLRGFSSECADEIKPVLSRMMRQLREFRDAPQQDPETSAEHYCKIEKSCARLWDFLEDLERYQGTDLGLDGVLPSMQPKFVSTKARPRRVRPVEGSA